MFIYVFYRTERTIVNELLLNFISINEFREIKTSITQALPINKQLIFSLPEGLWVFSTTLVSKNIYFKIANLKINCIFFPLLFSIGLEFFQLVKITDGTFDFIDVISASIFWFIAYRFINSSKNQINLIAEKKIWGLAFTLSFTIVLLSDVWI